VQAGVANTKGGTGQTAINLNLRFSPFSTLKKIQQNKNGRAY